MERITKKCGRFEFEDFQTEIKTLIESAISEYDQVVAMQSQYDLKTVQSKATIFVPICWIIKRSSLSRAIKQDV